MRTGPTVAFLLAAHICSIDPARPQASDLVGRWRVDFTFEDQVSRSLRFEAKESGKGTVQLEGSRSNWDEPARPFEAKWTADTGKRVTFSSPIEFPIGNVGREPGTVVFKGAFESDSLVTGDVAFFQAGQDPFEAKAAPSKTGRFRALRVTPRP